MNKQLKTPNLTKEVRIVCDKLSTLPSVHEDTYEAARAGLARMQAAQSFKDDVERSDYDIPLPDGTTVHARLVRKVDITTPLPIIFYIHGGGWVMGDAMAYDRVIRKIAAHVPALVVFVEYALAPLGKYPKPVKELWGALDHILNNPSIYNADTEHVILMGDSAGGNMAAVLAYYAKQQGVNIDFQLLLYPVTNGDMDTPSFETFAQGPWLTRLGMEWFWNAYAPDPNIRRQPMVSPLLMPIEELRGLPPTLIITAENDVLRDEGEAYAARLSEAGVETTCVRINGTIHDFIMLAPLAHTFPTKTAFRLIISTLRYVLKHIKNKDEII